MTTNTLVRRTLRGDSPNVISCFGISAIIAIFNLVIKDVTWTILLSPNELDSTGFKTK